MTSSPASTDAVPSALPRASGMVPLAARMWRHAASSDVNGLAAEIALRSFLAFIPFFVVVVTLGSVIGSQANLQNPADQALGLLADSLSPDVSAAINTELERVLTSRPGGVFGAAVVGTIALGASAGASVLKGINRAYDLDEKRPWWTRWLLGLCIALLAEGVLSIGLALLVAAQILAHAAAASPETPRAFWLVGSFLRWPLGLVVLLLQAALVYRIAPCGRMPWRWVTPGAVVFAVGWLIGSAFFNVYADLVGAYTAIFGVLGGVVVLLIWFQVTAYALLFGAELNAALTAG